MPTLERTIEHASGFKFKIKPRIKVMYFGIDAATLQVLASMVFVFAVVFGTLSLVNKLNSRSNILISLVFASSVLFYPPLFEFVWQLIPIASVMVIVLFFVMLLLNLFGSEQGKTIDTTSLVASLGLLLLVFGSMWNRIFGYYLGSIPSSDVLWGIGIVLFLLMLFAVSKEQQQ